MASQLFGSEMFQVPKHPYISAQNGGTGNGLAWTRKAEPLLQRRSSEHREWWERRERSLALTPEHAADHLAAVAARRQEKRVYVPPAYGYPATTASGIYHYPAGSLSMALLMTDPSLVGYDERAAARLRAEITFRRYGPQAPG